MKRTLMGMFAAVTMSVAFVAAQAAQTPPASASDDKAAAAQDKAQDKSDKAVTFAGCLEAGSAPGSYVLSNASEVKGGSMTPAPKASASATDPQTGATATATATAAQSFKITGSPVGFDLANNLNHKVQVTGTLADISASTSAVAAEPNPAGQAAAQATAMKTLTVRSAKSIADRCTDSSR